MFWTYHLHWSHHNSFFELTLCDTNLFSTIIDNKIKYLLANIDDKYAKHVAKQDVKYSDQNAKFDTKFENKFQILSLWIKEYSSKFSSNIDDQDKKIFSFTTSYN